MNDPVVIVKNSKLAIFIKNRFPGYKKTKVYLYVYALDKETETPLGGWDGGSKDSAWLVTGKDYVANPAPQKAAFTSENANDKVQLDANQAMVVTSVFAGKPGTMVIRCTQAFFDSYMKD